MWLIHGTEHRKDNQLQTRKTSTNNPVMSLFNIWHEPISTFVSDVLLVRLHRVTTKPDRAIARSTKKLLSVIMHHNSSKPIAVYMRR